jgi:hypothetical protein
VKQEEEEEEEEEEEVEEEENNYERLRLERIEENNRMLASLGLFGGGGGGGGVRDEAAKPKKKAREKKKKQTFAESALPTRRSSRMSGIVNYDDDGEGGSAAQASQTPMAELVAPRLPPIGEAFKTVAAGSGGRATAFASRSDLLDSGVVSLYTGHRHKIYSHAVREVTAVRCSCVGGGCTQGGCFNEAPCV